MINFLNAYKEFYKDCYNVIEKLKSENSIKDRTFIDYETKIKELEKRMLSLETDNEFLTKKISRKLSFKERFLGKFMW